MYNPLRDKITSKTPLEVDAAGRPIDQKLRLAVVALLWEMAHIDGRQSSAEFIEVVRSIDHEFHLLDEQSGELIQLVDFLHRQSPQFDRFIAEINQLYSQDQKQYLLDLIWKVAKADGLIEANEREFIKLLSAQLMLND